MGIILTYVNHYTLYLEFLLYIQCKKNKTLRFKHSIDEILFIILVRKLANKLKKTC